MKASDLMTRTVITLRLDTTVEQIARLLITHRINSAPVVDEAGHVIGIVSEHDLFLKERGIPFSAVKLPTLFKKWVDPKYISEIYENARLHTAEDIMTRDVICIDHDDAIGHVAWLMMQWGVERVPVLENERIVGILSRSDLIALLAEPE